jgi:hypothetical protein
MSKSAEILEVIYEYPALPDWAHIGPSGASIPTGVPVNFALKWKNTGNESLEARAYLKTIDSVGEEYSLRPDIWYPVMEPEEEIWVYYETITFTGPGSYTLRGYITEGSYEESLESFEVPLVIESGGGAVSTLNQVMPLVIMAVALGVMVPAMRGATMELEEGY